MPTGSYDLIVIGNEPAGLVAAALCARRGMRVLVCRTERARPTYTLGPFTLPARALPVVGLSGPAISRVLDELHVDHTFKRRLVDHEPPFQLIGPDQRLDVGADVDIMGRELDRELGDAAALGRELFARGSEVGGELDAALGIDATFPPTGFWDRRGGRSQERIADDAAAWLESAGGNPLLAAFAALPAAASTRTDPRKLAPTACARALALWRRGTGRIAGDWRAFEELLASKLTGASGEIREARVSELTWSWGKVSGVRLEKGEELGAEHVIAAMPMSRLAALTGSKQPKRLTQTAEQISATAYRYTLNLVVAETGVPEGMARTALYVVDPEAPLVGANAIALHVAEPDDAARLVITVEAVCPAPESGTLEDAMADLRASLRERLDDVMPFVGDHILLAHSPNEALPAEGTEGAFELSEPIPPLPLWSSDLESHLGISAVPYDLGIKRLTVASSQILTGLGLEGDFAAGWGAAKIASSSSGKRREMPKDDLFAAKR